MSKSREKRNHPARTVKQEICVLVEGRKDNKSENTYFSILNRSMTDKVIKTFSKDRAISQEISKTPVANIKKVVVCDTDINSSHDMQIFKAELDSFIRSGYTVYVSNKSWETWIGFYFENGLPDDYEKTEKWYSSHRDIWVDNIAIQSAIQKSENSCDNFSLPHGISTNVDIEQFVRQFKECNTQPFSMVGFLMEALINM